MKLLALAFGLILSVPSWAGLPIFGNPNVKFNQDRTNIDVEVNDVVNRNPFTPRTPTGRPIYKYDKSAGVVEHLKGKANPYLLKITRDTAGSITRVNEIERSRNLNSVNLIPKNTAGYYSSSTELEGGKVVGRVYCDMASSVQALIRIRSLGCVYVNEKICDKFLTTYKLSTGRNDSNRKVLNDLAARMGQCNADLKALQAAFHPDYYDKETKRKVKQETRRVKDLIDEFSEENDPISMNASGGGRDDETDDFSVVANQLKTSMTGTTTLLTYLTQCQMIDKAQVSSRGGRGSEAAQ